MNKGFFQSGQLSSTPTIVRCLVFLTMSAASIAHAQSRKPFDLVITYNANRSLRASSGENFWAQGGSAEFGVNLRHGWGLVADLTGTHTSSIGSSGIPLSLITAAAGPRYQWHRQHKLSLYGQGLLGGAYGFQSFFPAPTQGQSSADSLAVQVGGGIDYRLTPRFGVRLLDSAWLRTQLPNAASNVQNNLRLGAGITIRF